MGAWAHGSFDNDDAMDWVSELEAAEDFAPIRDALDAALEDEDYVEATEASMGLAAAEVVAALLGRPVAALPEEITGWIAGKKPPQASLVKKARRVVQRVLANSELKDLWEESAEADPWRKGVENLLQRLSAAPA